MQQINKRIILSAAALLLVCGLSLSSGSALARHGADDVSETVTSEAETHNSAEIENHSRDLLETFRQKGKEQLQVKKEHVHIRTLAVRQKACEARKAGLARRMNNAVEAAQRHQSVFDKIYTRVKDFHDAKNLSTPDYDNLVAAANSAQTDAAAKIAALKALDVSVDCTQVDSLADNISAFREAVRSTRDSLKDYRKALVNLITALHDTKTSSTSDTEGDQ